MKDLDKFLADAQEQKQMSSCLVCSNKEVSDVVSAFLGKVYEGTTSITLFYLHEHMLRQMGGPRAYETIKRHVKVCLGRDPRTGKAIDDE